MPERKPLSLRRLLFGRASEELDAELTALKRDWPALPDAERRRRMAAFEHRIGERHRTSGLWLSHLGGGMGEWRHRRDDSGAPSLDERLAGLERTGTTPAGVPIFRRVRVDGAVWRIGACLAVAGLFLAAAVWRGSLALGSVGVVAGLIGGGGLVSYGMLSRLVSLSELSARTGRAPAALAADAQERGVRPVCLVDGEERYDPRRFRANTLLRASSPPAADTLPRPAAAASTSAEPETLMRPVPEDGDA